jgi:hypothetical protein
MSSKRQKKIAPNTHPASDSEALPAAEAGAPAHVTTGDLVFAPIHFTAHSVCRSGAATDTKKSGACTSCHQCKIRCEFTNEEDNACVKCTRDGNTCIPQESHTRPASAQGKSAPPADLPSQESHVHNDTTSTTQRCSNGRK